MEAPDGPGARARATETVPTGAAKAKVSLSPVVSMVPTALMEAAGARRVAAEQLLPWSSGRKGAWAAMRARSSSLLLAARYSPLLHWVSSL